MAIDASIPLQVQQYQPMQSLSNVLGVAQGAQALQNAQLANQQGQQALQSGALDLKNKDRSTTERAHVAGVLSRIKDYMGPDGTIDKPRLSADILAGAPTTGAEAMQQVSSAEQAGAQATQAISNLSESQRRQVGDYLYAFKGKPPEVVQAGIQALGAQAPFLAPAIKLAQAHLGNLKSQDQIDGALDTFAHAVQTAPIQQSMATPAGVQVSDNQASSFINTKPGASVPVGATIPGTSVQLRLPPQTPVVNGAGQPGYLGPQGGAPVQPGDTPDGIREQIRMVQSNGGQPITPDIKPALDREVARLQAKLQTMKGSGFVASGLSPTQTAGRLGSVGVVNEHWAGLNKAAETAPLMEGLISNIQSLAPKAITGTESAKKAYVVGLLNSLHLGDKATGNLQTDTDLLEKNMAQLAMGTPASSDAMRTLVLAARPHSTMSQQAIDEAAAQLKGQVQATRATRNALSAPKAILDATGDATAYNAVKQQIEQVADPRVWQYEALGPGSAAAKAFVAKMSPADQKTFIERAKAAEDMHLVGVK